jgi:hypothetical protein
MIPQSLIDKVGALEIAAASYVATMESMPTVDAKRIAAAFRKSARVALFAEIEGLVKDAERYRWLRDGPQILPCICTDYGYCEEFDSVSGAEADAAIDTARAGRGEKVIDEEVDMWGANGAYKRSDRGAP